MKAKRNYTVYCHTNKTNGKKYVGLTCTSLEKRAGKNGRLYSQCPYFYRAIQKYGWDGFKHEILEDNLTKEEACAREIYYISEYKTTDHAYGYNIQEGGQTGNQSEETRRKMSESIKKTCQRPEVKALKSKIAKQRFIDDPTLRERIGARTRGKEMTKKKIIFSEEDIARIKEEAKKSTKKAINAKGVLWVEYNIVFASVAETARITGLKTTGISTACAGKNKTAYGFHWKYVETDIELSSPIRQRVRCVETGIIYKSVSEAEKLADVPKGSIPKVLSGVQELGGGCHWEYVDKDISKYVAKGKPIRCVDTNEIFNSVTEAQRVCKLHDIQHALKNCNFTCRGLHWVYVNEEDIPEGYYELNKKQLRNQILCVTNGKIYDNAERASEDLNMSNASVLKVANGISKQAKGYVFKFVHPELR